MTRIIAHLLAGVAFLLGVGITPAVADVVPPGDIVTLAPSIFEGGPPCTGQAETNLDQIITPAVGRIPFVIPDGHVFVLTGVSWFDVTANGSGAHAIQITLVDSTGFGR